MYLTNQKRSGLCTPTAHQAASGANFLFKKAKKETLATSTRMPRSSAKQRAVRELKETIAKRSAKAEQRFILDLPDCDEDDLDDFYIAQLEDVQSKRYHVRKPRYRKRDDRWKRLLHKKNELNDTEFLSHFHVTRSAFWKHVNLIGHDSLFQSAPHRTFRGRADLHLLVLLKYLGTYGNGDTSPKLAQFFGIGSGSINRYHDRATKALLKLEESTITWPDESERLAIAQRIQAKYAFPNCVSMVDDTLLPLERKPEVNGEDYFTRKGGYAINALIMCDDVACIRDVIVGWPGSVHDNPVWTNTSLSTNPPSHFNQISMS